jgi:hypothetical protein
MADITLTVGQTKGGVIKLFDNVTNSQLNAVFANQQISNTNPEFANIVPHSSQNSFNASGVTPGLGSATVSVTVTYTDAGNGQIYTETKTSTFSFEVVGSPNGSHIEVTFL